MPALETAPRSGRATAAQRARPDVLELRVPHADLRSRGQLAPRRRANGFASFTISSR